MENAISRSAKAADVHSQITPVGHLYMLNSSILYKDASQLCTAVLCIQLQKKVWLYDLRLHVTCDR